MQHPVVDWPVERMDVMRRSSTLAAGWLASQKLFRPAPGSSRISVWESLEVDFLHSLAGLSERDVRRQSVAIEAAGGIVVRIMHPLYCLKSRISNLILLPSKRNRYGLAQAQLAVSVLREHLRAFADTAAGNRQALRIAERVVELALSEPGKRCFLQHRIDVLEAIPVHDIRSTDFRNRCWPQALQQVEARRAALRKLLTAARQEGKGPKAR